MSTEDGYLYAFNVSNGFVVAGFPVATAANYGTPAVDLANNQVYVLAAGNLFAFKLDGSPAWTVPVGAVGWNYNEGPVVEDGFVYIKAGEALRKYGADSTLQWSSPTGGSASQPSLMGDYVYVNTETGLIRKYDKNTGAEVVGSGFPIATGFSTAALTTVDGKIFNKADVLYAYNDADGTLAWSAACGGDSTYYGSVAVADDVVYAYGFDGRLYAFDENSGATLAGFPSVLLNPDGYELGRNWGSPAVAGGKVFIGAGTTQRLKVVGAAGSAQAGEVLDDHLTFSTDTQGFDLCSAVIADGWVFVMLDGGGLYAFYGGQGAPSGALVINNGDTCTDLLDVSLTLDNGGNADVVEMRISEDPFFTGAAWQPYAQSSAFTLSAGLGTKTVYAQLKDNLGQLSNVFADQIDYPCNTANHPPVAVCQNVVVEAGPNGLADASIDNGSYDPDGDAITLAQDPPGPYPLGTNTVVLTVTDANEATGFCTALVIVADTQPPEITCPDDIVVDATSASGAVVSFSATAADIADPAPAVGYSQDPGTVFPIGVTLVTCTATDWVGNQATCQFSVTVRAPLGIELDVLAQLVALRATITDRQIGRKLDEAILEFSTLPGEANDPAFWVDDTHLQPKKGERVFVEKKNGVEKLEYVARKSAVLAPLLNAMIAREVLSCRVLAEVVLPGAKPAFLPKALQKLAEGDAMFALGMPHQAIDKYKESWMFSTK